MGILLPSNWDTEFIKKLSTGLRSNDNSFMSVCVTICQIVLEHVHIEVQKRALSF